MTASGFGEFRRGFKPLLGAVIGAGCGISSISFYTHSVFANAISTTTDWSMSQIQLGVTIMILMPVITAPVIGWMIDKFGARRIGLCSIPIYGLTLAAFALTDETIASYHLLWACMALLSAGTLPITWTRVVSTWFDRRRGLALGITLAGTGIAATLAPSYVTSLIAEYGWRNAYAVLALTITVISLPGVYFLFTERPNPGVESGAPDESAALSGINLAEALQGYRFWAMGIGLLLVAAGISGLIVSLVPLLVKKGLSASSAAGYAGLIGVNVILGRLLAGYLIDRFWAPMIAAIFLCAPCVAALILTGSEIAPALIIVSALIIGLAAGAELDLFAYLTSRFFGLRHYGAVYGGQYVFFSIGAGAAPFAFGRAFDHYGSYDHILLVVASMSIVGALLMLTLGRYPDFSDEPVAQDAT
jgi:MFS family permease